MSGGVVAIAGAAGGLGPEVARNLAARGASLSLGGRDAERLNRMAGELGLPDERVLTHAVDLLHLDSANGWAEATAARFGRIDAMVHMVGGWRGGSTMAEAPIEDDMVLYDALVRTLQVATRAFLPALAAAGGRFVLLSSPQAESPSNTSAAYGTAKAAAEAWTLALAQELEPHGGTANIVRVNAIVTAQMRAEEPDREFRTFTDAGEIADGIAFLLSPAARRMNGRRLSLHP